MRCVRARLGYKCLELADGCELELEVELLFLFVEVVGRLESAGVTLLMTSNSIEVNSLEPKLTRQDQAELLAPRHPKQQEKENGPTGTTPVNFTKVLVF